MSTVSASGQPSTTGAGSERASADRLIDLAQLEHGWWQSTARQRRAKRALDVTGAALLLLILAPLLALTAIAICLTSPGAPVFKQRRVGENGETFTLLKLRTMYQDAEATKAALADDNDCDGPVFKIRRDPRVTPLGRILRRCSLDELPQLWNVLRGEMSLVGPRPALPEEAAQYSAHTRLRLAAKPGLTCIWQVSGRSDVDFDTWVEMDLEYLRTWTFWLDVRLLLKTLPAVLSGRGAY